MEVEQGHPIRRLGEERIDVYHVTDDNAVLAEIDFDGEAGLPIFGFAKENGSHTVFLFPEEGQPYIRVLFVKAEDEGDMEEMLDFITERFGMNVLSFFNITNQHLIERVVELDTKTVKVHGEKVLVGTCTWDPDGQ